MAEEKISEAETIAIETIHNEIPRENLKIYPKY